jgi:enamine deaminase RidA (YjgF/YER057c/UK114 family)
MPRGERINPPGVHTPQANYVHVTRLGNTLYLSGQLGLDADGKLVGAGDAAAQAEQCYRNIKTLSE